ncbi:hypothetical protein AM1_B0295 (plasmid) [Acaryochloris marina MBIC11017]|uniref:Uncharacterized protein n=1 Tax=Acaryochloris marina (strain MBIC 11017) TaxID=329726 RepID=A8ZLI7_ACAM1|nr:hypothetical protein AM1_B0295 [Acaryochloris marina MBIC11017]
MIGSIYFNPQIPFTHKHFSNIRRTEADWERTISQQLLNFILAWLSHANHLDHQPNPTKIRIGNSQQSKPRKYPSSLQRHNSPIKRLFRSLLPRLPTIQLAL